MATKKAEARLGSTIRYAGYGVWNSTCDCTGAAQKAYDNGMRVFLAGNQWCRRDPAPGKRKYLFIIWTQGLGPNFSGVVGEDDSRGIQVP